MNPIYIVIVFLLIACLFSLPGIGFMPGSYGYYPSGGLGLVLLILLVLVLTDRA